ncbi:Rieske (2Fe-2S) protein [Streptomyces cyanogenus]|uniref:Cytochrome bc1 complex Rieske iron-sulfur subunit n=1 Tax=Streptomyces cyanogenus TaxID=80860 RepID=A0ABX7TLX2_STRCY|nr:Rieske (2Fe-2S) protein [Streptomyces cyanogenus]QTD97627.1 Cytochrome b6-f complex iron-sulfur subunit [Streptomyces cyanogenus]
MPQPATRRTVVATGAGALALGCVGCGGKDGGGATASASSAPDSVSASASAAGQDAAATGGTVLARTGDIPEGGGMVFTAQKVVVTQPKKGDFKAFSAVCTHQGCMVNAVADGTIDCPCHGSRFRIDDGSVAHGPATRPLPERSITVDGNSIRLT